MGEDEEHRGSCGVRGQHGRKTALMVVCVSARSSHCSRCDAERSKLWATSSYLPSTEQTPNIFLDKQSCAHPNVFPASIIKALKRVFYLLSNSPFRPQLQSPLSPHNRALPLRCDIQAITVKSQDFRTNKATECVSCVYIYIKKINMLMY